MADADASVSERFIHVYERIQDVENIAGGNLEEIQNNISELNNSVEKIDNNIDSIESDVNNLGDRVQQLE
jgi:peptidoglycan hydrolase CwlO-like protein